ncbi:MAG: Fe-S cluster assembly protein SufD [Acidobacteria bacterium]|nr:MAG: Fe-S cluster assembly protein SufD [Acidobacteriota bacterium]
MSAIAALREQAQSEFARAGYPTTREEEWKFTNVAPIAEAPFAPAPAVEPSRKAIEPFLFDGAVRNQLVIVNGRVSKALSSISALPKGVTIDQSNDAIAAVKSAKSSLPFVAQNTALFEQAVVISVAPHTVVEEPVHILFVNAPGGARAIAATRLLVAVGEHAQITVIESYAGVSGDGVGFTNAVTDFVVSASAVVNHYKIQRETATAFHVAATFVQLGRSATFASQSLTLGGKLVRNDVFATLDGEGAECTLNGLYLAGGDALVDNHTSIDHAKAHCPSHEVYKGILSGRAKAVFNGKIVVRQDAQKTDAKQTNKALLLSDDATINTKPQLEIFADDVKCTHGAAIGQLDDDAMFYLRARGIAERDARDILIHAFAGEILDHITIDAVRAKVESAVFAKLESL